MKTEVLRWCRLGETANYKMASSCHHLTLTRISINHFSVAPVASGSLPTSCSLGNDGNRRSSLGSQMTYRGTTRSMNRTRSAGELFRVFLSMLGRRRRSVGLALGLLTLGTLLGLLPPAATKLVIDYAFTGESTSRFDGHVAPRHRGNLTIILSDGCCLSSLALWS